MCKIHKYQFQCSVDDVEWCEGGIGGLVWLGVVWFGVVWCGVLVTVESNGGDATSSPSHCRTDWGGTNWLEAGQTLTTRYRPTTPPLHCTVVWCGVAW